MSDARPTAVGITGKLPAHGDYVRRGGPTELLTAIDGWLDAELSRACAAGAELDVLVERLDGVRMLVAGAWGRTLAVVVASEDRVGRRWPIVGAVGVAGLAVDAAERWCADAAQAIAQARDGGETVDTALARLGGVVPAAADGPASAGGWWRSGAAMVTMNAWPRGEAFDAIIESARDVDLGQGDGS